MFGLGVSAIKMTQKQVLAAAFADYGTERIHSPTVMYVMPVEFTALGDDTCMTRVV